MAHIRTATRETIYSINCWLGLNENTDGDTLLKPGEAAEMRNYRITRDGNLQKRPGYKTIHDSKTWTGPIRGIWHGYVGGAAYTVVAADGDIFSYDFSTNTASSILAGEQTFADADTKFFGFGGKLYALNGSEYLEWDGGLGGFSEPAGYRPLIVTAAAPTGGGTALESINKLNGLRRVRFSPTGAASVFQLPEKGLTSIDWVKNTVTGNNFTVTTDYTVNLTNGTVTFTATPTAGTNTIEVGYTYPTTYRAQVEAMKYAEIYNGSTDVRVFIYGDGTNQAYYTGLDEYGTARADYWPDLNVINAGSANTPITGMVRHFSSLAVFKTDSAYVVNYGQITLASGALTAAFYITPVNRSIGNLAPGQIQLVDNNPWTLFNSAVYEWRLAGAISDERRSKCVSDRVRSTLYSMDLSTAFTYDDNERQECYVVEGGTALVYNYAADVWYKYTDFNLTSLIAIDGALYGCTSSGNIVRFSRTFYNDDGAAIDCYWQSGSMAFDADYRRKYSGIIFITLKPESSAKIGVTLATNRKSIFPTMYIAYNFLTFENMNFAHLGFSTNTKPQTARLRIKAKKFTYYQLIFESNTDWSTATVLSANIKLRYGGDVK